MGQKSRKRREFLQRHPICCFCGGHAPAVEIDHFPSRSLFQDKQWPEGYEFPACESCNDASREDEAIVALLSRLYPDSSTQSSRAEIVKYMRGVARNFPGLLERMQPTAEQLREARDKYGVAPLPGRPNDLPVLSVRDERIHDAVANFGRKLGLALYYKHTAKVLRSEGGVAVRWYSNVQVGADEIPRELADVLPHFPRLERLRRDLSEQFFYRIGMSEENRMAAYLAMFRRSFAIVGFIHVDAVVLQAEHVRVLHPYKWSGDKAQDEAPL